METRGWRGVAFEDGLLEVALDHLTLGRASLYAAILEGTDGSPIRPRSPRRTTLPPMNLRPPAANWTPPWTASAAPAKRKNFP